MLYCIWYQTWLLASVPGREKQLSNHIWSSMGNVQTVRMHQLSPWRILWRLDKALLGLEVGAGNGLLVGVNLKTHHFFQTSLVVRFNSKPWQSLHLRKRKDKKLWPKIFLEPRTVCSLTPTDFKSVTFWGMSWLTWEKITPKKTDQNK